MPDQSGVVRDVAWRELFPWLILVRAVRLAFSLRVLVLGALGLVLLQAGWWAVGGLFSGTDDPWLKVRLEQDEAQRRLESPAAFVGALRPDYLVDPARASSPGPLVGSWWRASSPFRALFDGNLSIAGLAYSILCCVWFAGVWGVVGGAIARLTLMDLARGEQLSISSALQFAVGKVVSLAGAPLMAMLFVIGLLAPVWLMGWFLRTDTTLLLIAIFWPVALIFGACAAVFALVTLFSWPLMAPTIAAESQDAFDALSRSFSYVTQRPLYYAFLVLIASLLGLATLLLVDLVAWGVIYFTDLGASWAAGAERMASVGWVSDPTDVDTSPRTPGLAGAEEASWALRHGAALMGFWYSCIAALALGFRYAILWCAASAAYLLLRRVVDATELDEVVTDEEQLTGLPELTPHETGVPEMRKEPPPPSEPEPPAG